MTDRELKLGEVRSIRSNGQKTLEEVELLFSDDTVVKFIVNRDDNTIDFEIDNIDLKYQDLECALSKSVVRDLYVSLRDLYNELTN